MCLAAVRAEPHLNATSIRDGEASSIRSGRGAQSGPAVQKVDQGLDGRRRVEIGVPHPMADNRVEAAAAAVSSDGVPLSTPVDRDQ